MSFKLDNPLVAINATNILDSVISSELLNLNVTFSLVSPGIKLVLTYLYVVSSAYVILLTLDMLFEEALSNQCILPFGLFGLIIMFC